MKQTGKNLTFRGQNPFFKCEHKTIGINLNGETHCELVSYSEHLQIYPEVHDFVAEICTDTITLVGITNRILPFGLNP